MTDTTGIEIPKPLDWQDFQRKSVVLFRCLIEDARLQEWGLGGQLQNGIDLLGCRNENPNRPVGVQCRRIETQLTPTKMRTDVEEARAIQPPLVEFIFATTAKRDRKIQQEALSITQELIKSGWTCRVVVMAWEDLQLEVARHPLALKAFFPQAYPDSATRHDVDAAVDRGTGVIKRDLHQQTTTLLERLDEFRDSRKIVAASYDPDLDPDAAAEPAALHTRITVLRELINNGRTRTAIKQLQTLLAQDGTLPPYARYRVIANIGAAHFYADRPKNAHESFSIALALRPDDPKAQVNMAYAELSLGQCAEAISIAKRILAQQPSNASAASILIQALKDNQSVTDPFALVPAAARGHAEVVSAAIIFLRRRNDISWFKVAADAAMAHPANVMLRQFAAEAVIQPIVADQEILLGKPIDPSVFQRVSAAADQLHAIWQDYVNTEEVTSDSIVPLAHNCAIALRFCDRSETAARLLDRTIETVGLDPELVRTRVLLHLHADEESQALALIGSEPDEPALALMAAEITTSNDPAAAMERLGRIRVGDLPCELQPVAHELAAQLAISLNAKPEFDAAMQRLTLSQHSTTTVRLLQARAVKAGLVSHPASSTAATNEVASHPQSIDEDEDIDDDDDTGLALPPSPELAPFVEHVIDQDAALTFVERIQAAVYLEHHGACEVASDLLHGRVALDRDTIGLRTYLAASVGANLTARAESILGSIPEPLLDLPHYLRAAATLYWNIGDARRAAPMIARLSDASPQRLDLLLWHIDALLRLDDNKTIRKLLAAPVETTVTGSVKQCARLVRALATFGQPERGLAVAYRQLAKNRDDPAAWLSFMSMILGPRDEAADSLLSQTVSGDYAIEIVDPDGVIRRFVIEVDDVVQKLERDAIPPTHPIALAVQGLKPGDTFLWPRTNASATVKSVKHKYLDAFHATLAQFNERFPTAKGFQQIKVTLEGEQSLAEIKTIAKARSDHITAQATSYAQGQLTLAMLAHLTGADPVETMLGLAETATPYRVAIGLAEERKQALASIAANEIRGCVVDAATLHCIRRLDLGEIVTAVCGPIAITQSTVDIFQLRLQNLDAFGGKRSGVMGYRDGRLVIQEVTQEQTEDTRRRSAADLVWMKSNCRIVPAQPAADPPALYRRLSGLQGARFFDDIYAASGAYQLLLVDDLFTRQLAGQFRVSTTWLQPVLMLARERTLISGPDYTRLITELIDIGQSFITIDPSVLVQALELDRQSGGRVPGRRFRLACRRLGGAAADPTSHCQTVLGFLIVTWNRRQIQLDTYALTGHALEAVLRGRTQDYQVMLSSIYAAVEGHHMLRRYILSWARGHFLDWP